MTGIEATSMIRRTDRESGSKSWRRIIGLTGNALSEDVSEFVLAGCDEVGSCAANLCIIA